MSGSSATRGESLRSPWTNLMLPLRWSCTESRSLPDGEGVVLVTGSGAGGRALGTGRGRTAGRSGETTMDFGRAAAVGVFAPSLEVLLRRRGT